jgi:1-pyrroline-4-hydroxy-2-carboxylate deaminase
LCRKAAAGNYQAQQRALELERALHVLSSFDEGVDLVLYYKYLMVLAGYPQYTLHFNAADALSDSQRNYALAQWTSFNNWYKEWREVGQ